MKLGAVPEQNAAPKVSQHMNGTTSRDDRQVERISLLDSLTREWLKLPLPVMQDVGPAVQTLGGLLKITAKETFASVSKISRRARLPVGTVRKHLVTLAQKDWINNEGRTKTRRGFLRRTATMKITKDTRDHLNPYGILPWWACCSIGRGGRLPWCAKAVLSVVMARLCGLKAGAERDGPGESAGDEEFIGAIDNMGGMIGSGSLWTSWLRRRD